MHMKLWTRKRVELLSGIKNVVILTRRVKTSNDLRVKKIPTSNVGAKQKRKEMEKWEKRWTEKNPKNVVAGVYPEKILCPLPFTYKTSQTCSSLFITFPTHLSLSLSIHLFDINICDFELLPMEFEFESRGSDNIGGGGATNKDGDGNKEANSSWGYEWVSGLWCWTIVGQLRSLAIPETSVSLALLIWIELYMLCFEIQLCPWRVVLLSWHSLPIKPLLVFFFLVEH